MKKLIFATFAFATLFAGLLLSGCDGDDNPTDPVVTPRTPASSSTAAAAEQTNSTA